MDPHDDRPILSTTTGEFLLAEYRLRVGDREWVALHTDAILTRADESRFLGDRSDVLPYGVALWPSAIALSHEVAARVGEFRGASVLELGAGTGLPGIVAASLGARVVQTDRHEVAMEVCRRNVGRNGVRGIDHRQADWTEWTVAERFDWIIGADILYGSDLHPALRRIFTTNLAPEGRILIADPFRETSVRLVEALAGDGWGVTLSKWNVGAESPPRPIGLFELSPPRG